MAFKLHRAGFDYAKELVQEGKMVLDERDDWSEPAFGARGKRVHPRPWYAGVRQWHLGIDDEQDEDNKGRYKFAHLHGMMEALRPARR